MDANPHLSSKSYFIGKDLSHAEDEKDFYDEIRTIQQQNLEQDHGVGLLIPYLFDYLGVLTTTEHNSNQECQLLVMQNLRNQYHNFRMLDLKMGQQTAQGGWQGKSRFRAMKQSVLDGMTNSVNEGYRLEGFDGNPARIESMDPLMDLLCKESTGNEVDNNDNNNDNVVTKTLLWGRQVTDKQYKKAKRIMLQTLTGAEIFRYFIDVHLEPSNNNRKQEDPYDHLLAVEMGEIVLHELVARLVHLATTCHKVIVPQKWIGSSVALGYDAGLLPPRDDPHAHDKIRSKVVVNVFDWGRSELLTTKKYQTLTDVEQEDRQRFWENYKSGMDRLAFNACREYFHHFTNTTAWNTVTLQVMDFDSMSPDDYIGNVTIDLPDPSDTDELIKLQECKEYTLRNNGKSDRGTIFCSMSWLPFPGDSRMVGMWRVHVARACNLPIMDRGTTNLSDPYVTVIAKDADNRRELTQMSCVKARTLNPIWREVLDLPVMRKDHLKTAMEAKGGMVEDAFSELLGHDCARFQYPEQGRDDITFWTECLKRSVGV